MVSCDGDAWKRSQGEPISPVEISDESVATFFVLSNEEALAPSFLVEALEFYECGGATAKAEHLRQEYKMVL